MRPPLALAAPVLLSEHLWADSAVLDHACRWNSRSLRQKILAKNIVHDLLSIASAALSCLSPDDHRRLSVQLIWASPVCRVGMLEATHTRTHTPTRTPTRTTSAMRTSTDSAMASTATTGPWASVFPMPP